MRLEHAITSLRLTQPTQFLKLDHGRHSFPFVYIWIRSDKLLIIYPISLFHRSCLTDAKSNLNFERNGPTLLLGRVRIPQYEFPMGGAFPSERIFAAQPSVGRVVGRTRRIGASEPAARGRGFAQGEKLSVVSHKSEYTALHVTALQTPTSDRTSLSSRKWNKVVNLFCL